MPGETDLQSLHTYLMPAPVELPCREARAEGPLCDRDAAMVDLRQRFGGAALTADALGERIDEVLARAGLHWYEVSNWAANSAAECKHNVGYWDGGDWWGAGPGAHSHIGGTRFWNVKHPARYAEKLAAGEFPVAGSELLTAQDRHLEELMLRIRLRTGLPAAVLDDSERRAAEQVVADGLMTAEGDRFVLTDRGRLLADAVVRSIAT